MIRFVSLLAQESGLDAAAEGADLADGSGLALGWLLLAGVILLTGLFAWTRRSRGTRLLAILLALLGAAVLVLAFPAARTSLLTGGQSASITLRRILALGLQQPFPFPIGWGILAGLLGLILALPRTTHRRQQVGIAISLLGLLITLAGFDPLGGWAAQFTFWFLAVLTIGSAAAAIAMRSPVYTAIWFAISLLGTAGLLLYQGAEFLGVATIVVYAGAIVVTFLFVLMLAQPEGHATYDRISWGAAPKPLTVLIGAWLLATLTFLFCDGGDQPRWLPSSAQPVVLVVQPEAEAGVAVPVGPLQQPFHMAHLGGQLFGRHLVSVELAGTLLLIALVGAVSIVIHGKSPVQTGGAAPRDVPSTGANRISTSGAPHSGSSPTGVPGSEADVEESAGE